MFYGVKSLDQLKEITHSICKKPPTGHGHNGRAVNMLLEDAIAETQGGSYHCKTEIHFGVNRLHIDDIKRLCTQNGTEQFNKYRQNLSEKFDIDFTIVNEVDVENSPEISLCLTRLFYESITHPIPRTIDLRANYYLIHKRRGESDYLERLYLSLCRNVLYPDGIE